MYFAKAARASSFSTVARCAAPFDSSWSVFRFSTSVIKSQPNCRFSFVPTTTGYTGAIHLIEADFQECSHGFRPGRKAHDALDEIRANLKQGRTEIYDADLSSYFDTIDHELLLNLLEQRIADRPVVKMIGMWLKCAIVDKEEDGKDTFNKPTRGTSQGGVLSPLLANLYLNKFDHAFHHSDDSPLRFANARLIRFADDFVVMARYIGRNILPWIENQLEKGLQLTINRDKTTIVKMKQGDNLNFLGFTMRYDRDLRGGIFKIRFAVTSESFLHHGIFGGIMLFKPGHGR
ncbi:MAG: hypothetical protein GY950_18675 [bacterium]|nr:hypothetical protein [bacterium]